MIMVVLLIAIIIETCLNRTLKNRQNKDLKTNVSLMKVESAAECSPWGILQNFWPPLSEIVLENQILALFMFYLMAFIID